MGHAQASGGEIQEETIKQSISRVSRKSECEERECKGSVCYKVIIGGQQWSC